jgi:hypothetical protein
MEKNMVVNLYDNMRTEIKFLIPVHAEVELKNLLSIEGWKVLFPRRVVNSIYFDTINNHFLYDSIYGVSNRIKYRVRWYNFEREFVVETKKKNAGIGTKIISDSFSFNSELPPEVMLGDCVRRISKIDLLQKSKVSYVREYYIHRSSGSRLTLDFDISSIDFESTIERQVKSFFALEVKADIGTNFTVSYGRFQSRFSKYCFSRVGDDSFY